MVCEVDQKIQVRKGYLWHEMGFFTRWDYPSSCRVLCIDTPEELQLGLMAALQKQSLTLEFKDPFTMHAPLIDQIILLYDLSVWRVRNPVRAMEKVFTSIMLLRRNS